MKPNNLQRFGLSLVIATGATYILTGLMIGLWFQLVPLSKIPIQLLRGIVFVGIGFAIWKILGKDPLPKS